MWARRRERVRSARPQRRCPRLGLGPRTAISAPTWPQLTHAALGLEPRTARSALGLLLTRPGPVSGGQAGRALVTIGIGTQARSLHGRSTGATAARPRRDRKWLLAARGTACKLFLYVTRLRLCVGAAHRASQLNLSKTLLRSRMSGSPVNELSAPPRGARRYFIRSSRLATALHISASKQKCSRAAVSALQRRSDAIPHEVPCTENEVAAMGR